MKMVGFAIMANIASVACALAAAFLAYQGKDGWGWFLFVAVILHGSVEWKERG